MPVNSRIPPDQQVVPIDMVAPGSLGLNTVQAGELLDPKYALQALNAVLDTGGRLSTRYGMFQFSNTQLQALPVQTLFEWQSGPLTYQQFGMVGTGPANPFSNWQTEVAIPAGTVTPATSRAWPMAFNNKLIALQSGVAPVVYTGAGNWNAIVATQGVLPTTNGVGAAAFGRVWIVDSDGQTLHYSGLLDETDWGSALSGIIDMHTVWPNGSDTITAVFAFNASLVVCGTRQIIFFTDGRGSLLGVDPTQLYVFDAVEGTGCVSQWTVVKVGQADVLYLSPNGVQSLLRTQTSRSNPVEALTKMVRDSLLSQVSSEIPTSISATYNALQGWYLLALPASKTVYVLDMRRMYNDDDGSRLARVTTWTTPLSVWSLATDHTQTTYLGMDLGIVAQYNTQTFTDVSAVGTTQSYTWSWLSPWMNFTQQAGEQIATRLKMLKQFNLIADAGGNAGLSLSWNTDFQSTPQNAQLTLSGAGLPSMYGINGYGPNSIPLSQYGLGTALIATSYDARARGQYYQFGVNATVTAPIALQQIQVNFKIGRISGPLSI